ncbi:MAG TPA: CHAT domain-containing tetratricopeptide repeat protein [Steroidobacteraceae bacterium]|nr:CHAT domain-containing tetratricopeptide repeat protein [Steroidobacteraceae bacterium]
MAPWLALAGISGCQPPPPPAPRVLLDQELAVSELGAPKRLSVSDPTPGYRLIEIDQSAVDVQLTQFVDGQRHAYDAPARRATPERACAFTRGGTLELIVATRDRVAKSTNRTRIRVSAVDVARVAPGGSALATECLEAEAGADHDDWPQADPGAQASRYADAAEAWTRLKQPVRAAQAQLNAAWMVTRRMPDSDANLARAIELGERARAGARARNDCVGASHAALQLAVPRDVIATRVAKGSTASTTPAAAMFAATRRDLNEAVACYDAHGARYFAAEAFNSLGSSDYYSGDYGASLPHLAEAAARFRAIAEPEGATRALSNANTVRAAMGQWRKAAEGFDELMKLGENAATDAVLADILDSSATTHVAVGNYDKALGELLQSSAIHEKAGDLRGLAQSLNTFATAYVSIGDAEAAREYAQRAVSVRERLSADDRAATENEQIGSLLLEGNAERQLGNLDAALAAHEKALKLSHADALGVQARLELARDRLQMNRVREAKLLLDEAAARVRPSWGTLGAQIDLERARAFAAAGRPESAGPLLAKLAGRFEAAGQPSLEIEVLHQLAAAQLASGQYAAARHTSDDCLARLDALRLATVNPMFRARLIATHRAAYELKVEMLLAVRARATARETQRDVLAEILAASDTARAGLVREFDAAPTADAKAAQDGARELAAEIALQEFLLQRAEYGYQLAADGAPQRDHLGDLRARFDASAAHLPPATSGFRKDQYVWENLPADTAVLSIVHSQAGLRRYLFTRETAVELPLVAAGPVVAAFSGLRRDVTRVDGASETAALALLSRHLLADAAALQAKRRWIVVADSVTSAVPFAALSLDADHYRPVILDHELSLALTTRDALALARAAPAQRRTNLARVAIFADPVFSPVDNRVTNFRGASQRPFLPTPRLAATAHEASSISSQLGGIDVKVFSGFDATRAAVLSPYVNAASVLHFATHATSSDAWPHGSGLLLSGVNRGGDVINGYLSTLDLLVSRRATDLVVLSACDTARGESTQTENVAGLARAFLGSGARRVVGTLWAVEDTATATLMSGFYRRLARGATAAGALRESQAEMAATGRFQRPAAWAAFVLYESVRRP